MKSEKFATIYNGKIIGIVDGYPEHELRKNQFGLSKEEFMFLKNIESIPKAKELIKSLEKRIKKIK